MKKFKTLTAILIVLIIIISVFVSPQTVSATDYKTMRDITAWELISEMTVGINIGNSLDSALNEGSGETAWGNPKITKDLILTYKNAGFNTIRLPVTWKGNMNSDGSAKTAWLNRVKEVVDWILEEGLYCIINTHHEQSWLNTNSEGMSARTLKFKNLWTSIANEFADYGDHLLFEGFNEILKAESDWSAATTTDYQNANALSQAFVDAVRATGGKNSNRILISSTYGAIHTTNGFVLPTDSVENKLAVEFHCYYPQAFCFSWGSQSTWGSTSDNSTIENYCKTFYNGFSSKQIPVILGEFGAVNKGNTSARASYASKVIENCEKYDIMPIWWDNGVLDTSGDDFGLFNRTTYENAFSDIVSALTVNSAQTVTTVTTTTTTTVAEIPNDKKEVTKTIVDWDGSSHWYINTSNVSFGNDGVTLTNESSTYLNTWSNAYEDYEGIRFTIDNKGTSTSASIRVLKTYKTVELSSGMNYIDINLAEMGIAENSTGDFNITLNGTTDNTVISDIILYKSVTVNVPETQTTTTTTTIAEIPDDNKEVTKTIVDWDGSSHWYINTSNVSFGNDGVTLTNESSTYLNTWSNAYEDYESIRFTIDNKGTSTSASIRVLKTYKTVELSSGMNYVDINLAEMGIAENSTGDFNITLNGTTDNTVISDIILYK